MDTSGLESFALALRTELIKGVRQRLRYWGFGGDGSVEEAPEEIEGGYIFRGDVHNDPGVPRKWRALKNAVNRHDVEHVAEEAAYTWFNRLVAIRILEKNGYMPDVLGYAEDTTQPAVLYRARQGIIDVLDGEEEQDVREALLDSDDDRAFRQLLIGVCGDSSLLEDVFGRVNDFTELLLPTGLLQPGGVTHELVTTEALSDEDYEQVELIGWLYQFYISEKKDEVYDSSGKFEPEDIPAATQIFTPRWIVRYMVENTIGKQWLEKYPESPLREEMEYLVENEDTGAEDKKLNGASEGDQVEVFEESEEDPTEPIFDDLPELQLFDPAAGSGHILVVGFDLLMEMYRERGYTDREAVELVLSENLKGLEIDRRAAQLARFALLMKAAQYDRRALEQKDLRPEVYAMPEPREFSESDLRAYLGDDIFDAHGAEIKEALDLIADKGQNVGSALKLELSGSAHDAVENCLAAWDEKTRNGTAQLDEQALHQELQGYMRPLLLLTDSYPSVAANPPYASSRNINKSLKNYLKEHYPDAGKDLFATFMKVFPNRTRKHGRFAFITPPSWMFLSSYEDLRTHYIDDYFFDSLLHLSRGIFGADFGSVATAVQKAEQNGRLGTYFRLIERTFQEFHAKHLHDLFQRVMEEPDFRYDFSEYEKDGSIPEGSNPNGQQLYHPGVDQQDFEKIPGATVAYWVGEPVIDAFDSMPLVEDIATVKHGMSTGRNKKFLRMWPELNINKVHFNVESKKELDKSDKKWVPCKKGGSERRWYGNNVFMLRYGREDRKEMSKLPGHRHDGKDYFFREGITWGAVSSGNISFRKYEDGFVFANPSFSLFSEEHGALLSFLNSSIAKYLLKVLSPTLNFNVGHIESLPISKEIKHEGVNKYVKPSLESALRDWNSHETSWDFNQHPLVHQDAASLEEAYGSWKHQATDDFLQLHANEEELNDLFIGLYGLEDELSPRVALDDITILEDELDRDALEDLDDERDSLSDEELRAHFLEDDSGDGFFKPEVPIHQFLSYGVGVMLGRYRLGHDGLHIAHPDPSEDELAPYDVPVPLCGPDSSGREQFEIDDDAIVPVMGRDSPFSDDAVYRMREIVRLIWGKETLTENLNFINQALSIGRSRGLVNDYEKTMEEWLVGDFWDWHKSLYSVPYYGKKPIYWLFRSPEGHFQVLVYMHRMDKFTPQRVRQDYLQRYQEWLRREIESLESEGEETLSADEAERLDTLREAAADCREYDAILKDVADQQIEIDLDEGVQNNYPKFGDALAEL